ncbi:hypothetical protein AB0O18_15970 [Streptomyces sp. NPDC093224]|uniref:hypothetical protein n=1 Tax=Streptomyces sp. NPDC093224 TaxID=3155198 RepID=UPI00341F0886
MTQNTGWGPAGAPGPGGWGGPQPWGGWAPPQPPKPGVIPLRPLGLGDIVNASFATLGRHWKPLAGVMLAVQGAFLLVMALLAGAALALVHEHIEPVFDPPYGQDPAPEHLTPFLVAAVVLFVLLLAVGLVALAMLTALFPAVLRESVMGRPTTFRALWSEARRRTPAVLGTLALTILIAGAPLLAALAVAVPLMIVSLAGDDPSSGAVALLPVLLLAALPVTVWLQVRLSLAPAAAVMEEAGPVTALRRSAALVKDHWWRVFGIGMLGGMIGASIAYVIQMPFQFIGMFGLIPLMAESGGGSEDVDIAGLTVAIGFGFLCVLAGGTLGQMFQTGYTQLVTGLLYVDRRIRHENLVPHMLAELAAQAPGTAPAPPVPPQPDPTQPHPPQPHPSQPDPRADG